MVIRTKEGLKIFYADMMKVYGTGYNAVLGRFSGLLNLFFTIATFLVVKEFNLGYIQTAGIFIIALTILMMLGYFYLKFDLLKAEAKSNFIEGPQQLEMYHRLQRIEAKLDKMEAKKDI